jgi:glycosyltransferase involved in cell wall biosynthesis
LKGDNEIVIVLSDAFPETLVPLRLRFEPLVGIGNVRVWIVPTPVRGEDSENAIRRSMAELVYEAFLASLEPDMIFVSSLFEGYGDNAVTSIGRLKLGVPIAVTLYDLIPLHDPERHLAPKPSWEQFYREKLSALSRADLLLAISDFSASDALTNLNNTNMQIVSISGACSDFFKPSKMPLEALAVLKGRLAIDHRYIITSGTVEPHKNLPALLKAYARLPKALQAEYKIVLVGHANDNQKTAYKEMCKDAGVPAGSFVVTGYVNDENLVALYTAADLMVFPSMDEGFGLPALEAMSCGTPTIGSSASSVPEVIGLSEAQFDPRDIGAMAELIRRGLEDESFRARLKVNAEQRAGAFSWEKTAQKALTAMLDLVAAKKAQPAKRRPPLEACLDALAASAVTGPERFALCRALAFDFPEPTRRAHLFVDVSELRHGDARTGCQRVTRSVLRAWLEEPLEGFEIMPVYATTEKQGYFYAHDFLAGLTEQTSRGPDKPIDYAEGDVFFGLDLQTHVVSAQKSYLQQMRRRGVLTRFLVYDLLPVQMPKFFPEGTETSFEPWLETISVSDGIVAISKVSADAFRTWQVDRGIVVEGLFSYDYVHLGADIESSLPTRGLPSGAEAVLSKIEGHPSFLSVGTVEPRKGYSQTLDAFELLWARGVNVNLVLVGKEGWKVDSLVQRLRNHPESGNKLFWLDGISDEYLGRIYAATTCLLAASEGEGFGLPLIEAAQAGLPILARDIEVFREVAGANATYFEAQTSDQLATAIERWLASFQEGKAVSSEGLHWLTWEKCAAELGRIVTRPPTPV